MSWSRPGVCLRNYWIASDPRSRHHSLSSAYRSAGFGGYGLAGAGLRFRAMPNRRLIGTSGESARRVVRPYRRRQGFVRHHRFADRIRFGCLPRPLPHGRRGGRGRALRRGRRHYRKNRVHRIRILKNGKNPQFSEPIFKRIKYNQFLVIPSFVPTNRGDTRCGLKLLAEIMNAVVGAIQLV